MLKYIIGNGEADVNKACGSDRVTALHCATAGGSEYRKGSCQKGDSCEYAHGVFECWLHPAQYRTRLCKDETGCSRKVCFFAHKHEDLRPLYASTGSAIPSPRSLSASAVDMAATLSPLTLSSSSAMLLPPTSTPPMSALSVRDLELELELLELENERGM